jgi:hypothetical protein
VSVGGLRRIGGGAEWIGMQYFTTMLMVFAFLRSILDLQIMNLLITTVNSNWSMSVKILVNY